MFGGFSRHFFRHVSISKNAYQFIIYNCGTASSSGAVLHKVKTLQQRARYGVQRMGLREISISTSLPRRMRVPASVWRTAKRMAALVYVFEVSIITFIVLMTAKYKDFLKRPNVYAIFLFFIVKSSAWRCSVAALQRCRGKCGIKGEG